MSLSTLNYLPLAWIGFAKSNLITLELLSNPNIIDFPTLELRFQKFKTMIFKNCHKIGYFTADSRFEITKESDSALKTLNLKWAKLRNIAIKEKEDIIVLTFTPFFRNPDCEYFGFSILQPEEAILELL